ncbi:MAG: hypothetical protein KDK25_10480 [Leptospiraceae bacterium]|nr:hypothetical protein [Leptospiraceae bacterium]
MQAWKFENDRKAYRTFLPFVRKRLDHLLQEEDIIHQTGLLAYIGSGSSAASIRNYQPVKDMAGELQGRNLQACAPLKKSVVRKQSGENRKNRFFQVRNSIQLTEEYRVAQYYVILEDLFTTGATANEASRILKKRSAAPVFVLSLFMAD